MSRSRRKTPRRSICGGSNKKWKRGASRATRAAVRRAVKRGDEVVPLAREVDNIWSSPKDGAARWFDARRHPKLMRK